MEEQYKGLLQNIVSSGSLQDPKTGTPWLPSESILKVVDEQFKSIITELEGEHDDNQKILDDAHAAVVKCNTDKTTAFDTPETGVLAKQAASASARGTHKACRQQEDKDILDMETKCGVFEDLTQKCTENQDWYVQYQDDKVAVEADNSLDQVVKAAVSCKAAIGTVNSRSATCDADQTNFVKAFCAYEKLLTNTCAAHDSCYNKQYGFLNTSTDSVKALEVEQKTIFRMVKKVDCYIGKLLKAEVNMMPKQSDIQTCIDLVPDDSSLDIKYETVADKLLCMNNAKLGTDLASSSYKPGKTTWYNTEMAGLTDHNKLNDNVQCPA